MTIHAHVIPLNQIIGIEINLETNIEVLLEINIETLDRETDLTWEIETQIKTETVITEVIRKTETDQTRNPIQNPRRENTPANPHHKGEKGNNSKTAKAKAVNIVLKDESYYSCNVCLSLHAEDRCPLAGNR